MQEISNETAISRDYPAISYEKRVSRRRQFSSHKFVRWKHTHLLRNLEQWIYSKTE